MRHTERLSAALAGRDTIEKQLREGGMAIGYLARDLKHREVGVSHGCFRRPSLQIAGGDHHGVVVPHLTALFDFFDSKRKP